MIVGRRWRSALVALPALALVVTAGAAAAASPDVTKMVLQPTDVPGAKVVAQGHVTRQTYAAAYQRTFKYAVPHGRSKLLLVQSEADVATTEAQAASDVADVERALRTKAGRAAFVAALAGTTKLHGSAVTLGRLRHPRVGDHAVELPVTVHLASRAVYESVLYLRLDRVVALSVVAGLKPVVATESAALAKKVEPRIGAQLVPVPTAPPTISGTAAQGQTLSATPGSWNASALTFTYQWQRCDAAAAACTAIDGATTSSYVVAPTDVGSTLKVVVTAKNRFGAPTAESAPTAVVT